MALERGSLSTQAQNVASRPLAHFHVCIQCGEAWRIVDPVLKAGTPIYEYEKGAWGPSEVEQRVSPAGGWHNPITSDEEDFRLVAKAG
jgi:hypothetical protein